MLIEKRVLPVLLLAAALVAGSLAAGDGKAAPKVKKLKPRRGHPVYLHADTAFVPAAVNRVPIVAFVNTTTAADAVDKFFPLLEEMLRAKPHYVIVPPAQVDVEAARKGERETYQALVRQWNTQRKFVPETVQRFAGALDAALLMGGEISEWQSEQVAWNVEGYSHSDVEVHLKLFSGRTGAVVWEARDKVELKSAPHDPQASSGVVDELGIQRGKGQIVPPAPPIEDAARQAAENLIGALP